MLSQNGALRRDIADKMKSFSDLMQGIYKKIPARCKIAYLATCLGGLLIHLPIMVSDIPNHDGLAYLYDSQNIVTSGRWFLSAACGISSFYMLPWLIGLLGLCFLGVASAVIVEMFEIKSRLNAAFIGLLFAAYPALASTFAYVFALDGYMLSLLLAVLSVFFTAKYKNGFIGGIVCLAFSMGIYQAYLPFAILLSLAMIVYQSNYADKLSALFKDYVWRYLVMGIGGGVLYYVILKLALLVQGRVLDDYQGINSLGQGISLAALPATIKSIYVDFVSYTLKARVLVPNAFAVIMLLMLFVAAVYAIKGTKKLTLFTGCVALILVPLCSEIIRIISPELNFHQLMKFHWVLIPVMMLVIFDNKYENFEGFVIGTYLAALGAAGLIFSYALVDNIGYFNLEKKYEKTYAYCNRLVDRMEQVDGYYAGIPVAIMGVVGDENYPSTDLTKKVTGSLSGLNGDFILYKAADYEAFLKNYMGVTFNFLSQAEIDKIYYSEDYVQMESFPGATSVKVIDGVLCVKTENYNR